MKNKKLSGKKISLFFVILLIFMVLLCFLFVFQILIPNIKPKKIINSESYSRNYHIIVTGKSENESFLQQVYSGVEVYSNKFNVVTELYVPNSLAADVSLQSLFNYASFVNADGIIAFTDQNDYVNSLPIKTDGTEIPLITVGNYASNLPHISFIGINYSSMGKRIAEEIINNIKESNIAFIISSNNQNNPNYSTLMNSLISTLHISNFDSYELLDKSTNENTLLRSKKFMTELNTEGKRPLLVCLSPEDTIRSAQIISELNKINEIDIIGYGDNDTVDSYFTRGVIQELISVDPKRIGESAIRELFEYRTTGYANNYITAEIQIRKNRK